VKPSRNSRRSFIRVSPCPSVVKKLKQKPRETRGHVSGEQAAAHRAETDLGHFAAAFGRERADAADLNRDAGKIREAAQRVGRNRETARVERERFGVGREVEVADEFIQHDSFAEDLPDVHAILPRHAHQKCERRVDPAENVLQRRRMRRAEMNLRPGDDVIRQRNHGDERDEHGDDVERELKTVACAAADRVNGIGRRARNGRGHGRGGFALLRFGQENFRDHQCGGAIQHGRGEQMAGGVLVARSHAHRGINRGDTAGDVRHAANHDGHDFALSHARHVRPDHQRRLGLAHKNVRTGGKRFAAARAHDFAHDPRGGVDDFLQNAPMIKQRRNACDDDDRAHDENREDDGIAGAKCFCERIRICKRAENEFAAVVGKLEQFLDDFSGEIKKIFAPRRFQNQKRERELQPDSPNDGAPREKFSVIGNRPCDRDHHEPTEKADELEFHLFFANGYAGFLVNVRVQNAYERKIAIALRKIKPVADDKKIGNLKADVIGADFFDAAAWFVEQHADFYTARFERANFR